jgi:non-specific serine/threonine protein kinase
MHEQTGFPTGVVGRLIGRRAELAEIRMWLLDEVPERLVTLTGVAGVGKTRLAVQIADQLREAFPDGVWFVEAAPLREGRLLADTVAMALDLPSRSPRGPLADLTDYLSDKKGLLVVDNCEHVLDECAQVVARALAAAPELRVLLTSRQALGVLGERVWSVSPLPAPEAPRSLGPEYPAMTLFAERARAVSPEFRITPENWDVVAQICRRLDGLPLAIELAAARLSSLSLDELLDGLSCRYELPATAADAVPARHRTLGAAIGWSYDLCTYPEQLLWQRASVFPDSFDLDAATEVCAGDGLPVDDVLDLVGGLVEKSILSHEERSGRSRYRLLDTLRQYGRDKLRASEQQTALLRRHRDHHLRQVEQHAAEWFGPNQVRSSDQLRAELSDIRSALEFSLSTPGETRTGQRLAATLWFYWISCGLLSEGRYWLDRALRVDRERTPERAKALWVDAWIAHIQGEQAPAIAMVEQCRAVSEQLGDSRGLAHAIHIQGATALVSDDLPGTETLLSQARQRLAGELAEAPHDSELRSTHSLAAIQLALALTFLRDPASAIPLCEECRADCEAAGEQWVRSYSLFGLALAEWKSGRKIQAAEHARESLRIKRLFYDVLGMAVNVDLLAWIAADGGAFERAAVLLGASRRMWWVFGPPSFGSRTWAAPSRTCETRCRRELGDRLFEASLRRGHDLSLGETLAYALA